MTLPYLEDQFDQLRIDKSRPDLNLEDGYDVHPAVHPSWKNSKRRMLFVLESLDSRDIKYGRLFKSVPSSGRKPEETNLMIATFRNTLAQSWKLYQEYLGINSLTETPAAPDFSIAVVNFNAIKYFHHKGPQRSQALRACAERAQAWIDHLEPTDIVILGDTASNLLTNVEDKQVLPYTRGWVRKVNQSYRKNVRVTSTLDLEPLYNYGGSSDDDEDDGAEGDASGVADLLYFVCRNLCNAYAGKHLHSVADHEAKVVLVDTIDKFKAFYSKLHKHEGDFGFDIESENLESYRNKFYTQQYSLDGETAYVIPLDHPFTCFDADELKYIHRKLAKFWGRGPNERLCQAIGANIQFDFKVVRGLYRIPVIYHKGWDVTAGESLLDENVGLFDRFKFYVGNDSVKTTMGNLRNLFAHYGNDSYFRMDFTKEQRMTFGRIKITEDTKDAKDAVYYAALDSTSVVHIKNEQVKRAGLTRISPTRTYLPYYLAHVSNQMSNTVHVISTMHQHGSHLDMEYLSFLMSKSSPLLTVKKQMADELVQTEHGKAANAALLKTNGLQGSGLWGKVQSLLEIGKPAHRKLLFFDVMGLKHLSVTDAGQPQIDKKFFAFYKDKHREADIMDQWQKASKLLSTYVKGWANKLKDSLDSAMDNCIRPSFGFFNVVTGRLNSFKPSLQQVPSRGPSAKYIKRMFTPKKGCLNIDYDYSANEVRFWGIIGKDDNLAASFREGQVMRHAWIKTPTPELKAQIKTKGDIHIQSVFRFFGIWVTKDHVLRDAIKAVVFGFSV